MPSVSCPHCGATLKVRDEAVGKQGRCPKCQEKFLVQAPGPVDEYGLAPLESHQPVAAAPLAPAFVPAPALESPSVAWSKQDEPERRSFPAWLLPAAVGGGLLMLALMCVVIWVGASVMAGGDGAKRVAGKNGAAVENPEFSGNESTPLVAPRRQATAGETSTVASVTGESADPGTWKVTADGVAPPPDLKSLIPLETVSSEALLFTRPDLAEAAVVERVHRADVIGAIDWVRCDLRQDKPIERIHLWKEDTPTDDLLQPNDNPIYPHAWSLSPSGQRLAVASSGKLWVFGRDGTRICRFPIKGADKPISWIGFTGEDAVWVRIDDRLEQHAIPSGDVTHKLSNTLYSPPSFTPGGKYLLAVTNNGLEIFSAADGSPAGVLKLPPGFGTILAPAVNPVGTKVAVALADSRVNTMFVVWDLATGKFEKAFELTYARTQRRLVENRLAWLGEEVLLVNHSFFHLGLGEIIADEWGVDSIPGNASPDGRLWQVRSFMHEPQVAQLGELAKSDSNLPKMFLTAASMPPPEMESVIKQTGGFAWHPGITVNGVLIGVPGKHREAVANGFADWLARSGFGVDPQAKIKIELSVSRLADTETTGNKIPEDQLTPAMRQHVRFRPYEEWVELLTVKNLKVEGMVYDASGKPAFKVPMRLVSRPIDKGANDDAVWKALATWQEAPSLPKTFFLDPKGKRIQLPSKYITPGADGVVDTFIVPPDPPPFSRDEFELAGE